MDSYSGRKPMKRDYCLTDERVFKINSRLTFPAKEGTNADNNGESPDENNQNWSPLSQHYCWVTQREVDADVPIHTNGAEREDGGLSIYIK